MSDARVITTEQGRSGDVIYEEGGHRIRGWWEFGGGDAIALVSMGSAREWQKGHPWAVERRSAILRFVADEVIRQRAPSCHAKMDEERGDIVLLQGPADGRAPLDATTQRGPQAQAGTFVRRYSNLKAMLGIGALVVALIVGGVMWVGKKVVMVNPASGVPLGECVRYGSNDLSSPSGIASLIQTVDPHLPEITGRGGNETTSISILLVPLDGTEPRLVPVVTELSGQGYGLARIMGSDGHTLWFDCTGLFGVHLSDHELITPKALREANPTISASWWEDPRGMDIVDGKLHIINADRSAALDIDPATRKAMEIPPKPSNARFERLEPIDHLAAGFITASGTWLGLHSPEELESDFKGKSWIKPVVSAEDAKRMRRLCKAELEPGSDTVYHRIRSIAPISDTEYLNAAFLRLDDKSEPLRLKDPDGALMIHTDAPGLGGKLIISRIDTQGKTLWSVDTGLHRSQLQQILPGADVFAFVGTRPPVEGKLSEPLVVVVENSTGKLTSHSLWR